MRKKEFYYVLILLLSSCSSKYDLENYIGNIGIEFSEPYKIDSIESHGFTDWILNADINVSETDKNRIIRKWKGKFGKTSVIPHSQANKKTILNNSTETLKIDGNYYYYSCFVHYEDKGGYDYYKVKLDTVSNNLTFNYESE